MYFLQLHLVAFCTVFKDNCATPKSTGERCVFIVRYKEAIFCNYNSFTVITTHLLSLQRVTPYTCLPGNKTRSMHLEGRLDQGWHRQEPAAGNRIKHAKAG